MFTPKKTNVQVARNWQKSMPPHSHSHPSFWTTPFSFDAQPGRQKRCMSGRSLFAWMFCSHEYPSCLSA